MTIPFTKADDSAMTSFYTQCERLMSAGHVEGYCITRNADSATLEIHVGGAVFSGTGPTIAAALIDIGKVFVQKFPSDGTLQ